MAGVQDCAGEDTSSSSSFAGRQFRRLPAVGNGVLELRVHVGAGYRVYCGRRGERVVILLCGGDKRSQARDIQTAKGLKSKVVYEPEWQVGG